MSTDEHCQAKESTAELWRALPSKGAYKSYGFMTLDMVKKMFVRPGAYGAYKSYGFKTLDMVKKCLYAPGRTGRTSGAYKIYGLPTFNIVKKLCTPRGVRGVHPVRTKFMVLQHSIL